MAHQRGLRLLGWIGGLAAALILLAGCYYPPAHPPTAEVNRPHPIHQPYYYFKKARRPYVGYWRSYRYLRWGVKPRYYYRR